MGVANQEAVKQLKLLIDAVEAPLKITFQHMHQGYPVETLIRFLKARDWNVAKANKMIVDTLNWRLENGIDHILEKPIVPRDLYKSVRDTQLVGFSGYTREGLPVISIGVGLSTFDKASVNYYVQSHIQINEYRDRVVLVVKPLLQERTRRKVQVLQGCGRDELLKIMDYSSLPHFCKKKAPVRQKNSSNSDTDNCFSLDHPNHQQLYSYMKQQAAQIKPVAPLKQGSVHVKFRSWTLNVQK